MVISCWCECFLLPWKNILHWGVSTSWLLNKASVRRLMCILNACRNRSCTHLPRIFWRLPLKMHLRRRHSADSKYCVFIILTNTGISQLSSARSERSKTTFWYIRLRSTHSTQKAYKIKTSLLLRGRDGDTMMSSESSESCAAAPPDSAVRWGFVSSAGDIQVVIVL